LGDDYDCSGFGCDDPDPISVCIHLRALIDLSAPRARGVNGGTDICRSAGSISMALEYALEESGRRRPRSSMITVVKA
jgi:hypothetical protein